MFAMKDGYSDYFTLLLGKTTIQATKIDLFLSMHMFQLAFFDQKFLLLIGWNSLMEILDFIKTKMKMKTTNISWW